MNKMKIKNLLIFVVFILFSFSALGFGATQPGTIFVPAGDSKIVDFSVQNGGGAKDEVVATLTVVDGEEIVELVEDNKYFIPINGEVVARVKVKVPANANPDDKYNVRLSFRAEPVGPSIPSGMVSLGYGVDIKFDVVASEPVKEAAPLPTTTQAIREVNYNGAVVLAIVIAAGVIIYCATRKKKTLASKKLKRSK